MAKKTAAQSVTLEIPDLGLSAKQIAALKKTFKSQLVSSMGEKSAAKPRTISIQVRIVFAKTQH
jgi:hypothetical protein